MGVREQEVWDREGRKANLKSITEVTTTDNRGQILPVPEKHLDYFPELSIWRTGVRSVYSAWGLSPRGENGRNINTNALPGCTWCTGSANFLVPLLLWMYWGRCRKTGCTWLWGTSAMEGRGVWIWKKKMIHYSYYFNSYYWNYYYSNKLNVWRSRGIATRNINKKLHVKIRLPRFF